MTRKEWFDAVQDIVGDEDIVVTWYEQLKQCYLAGDTPEEGADCAFDLEAGGW